MHSFREQACAIPDASGYERRGRLPQRYTRPQWFVVLTFIAVIAVCAGCGSSSTPVAHTTAATRPASTVRAEHSKAAHRIMARVQARNATVRKLSADIQKVDTGEACAIGREIAGLLRAIRVDLRTIDTRYPDTIPERYYEAKPGHRIYGQDGWRRIKATYGTAQSQIGEALAGCALVGS